MLLMLKGVFGVVKLRIKSFNMFSALVGREQKMFLCKYFEFLEHQIVFIHLVFTNYGDTIASMFVGGGQKTL